MEATALEMKWAEEAATKAAEEAAAAVAAEAAGPWHTGTRTNSLTALGARRGIGLSLVAMPGLG